MRSLTPIIAIGASLVLAGCGGSHSGSTPVAAPTASISASPATVSNGGTSTLSWSSSNATACTASGAWTGTLGASGSQSEGPLTAGTTYSLTCAGAGGTSSTVTVTVNIVPTAAVTANPASVSAGGASTLSWTSTNATACTASGGWSGTLAPNGSQGTGPLTGGASYALVCSGAGGSSTTVQASVTIAGAAMMTVSPTLVALALQQTQQFTATIAAGGGASWAVDGVAGGNSSVGLVSPAGLYTPGTALGTHILLATSSADPSLSATATVFVTDLAGVDTYHNDLARDGANTQEYALSTADVNTTASASSSPVRWMAPSIPSRCGCRISSSMARSTTSSSWPPRTTACTPSMPTRRPACRCGR